MIGVCSVTCSRHLRRTTRMTAIGKVISALARPEAAIKAYGNPADLCYTPTESLGAAFVGDMCGRDVGTYVERFGDERRARKVASISRLRVLAARIRPR